MKNNLLILKLILHIDVIKKSLRNDYPWAFNCEVCKLFFSCYRTFSVTDFRRELNLERKENPKKSGCWNSMNTIVEWLDRKYFKE